MLSIHSLKWHRSRHRFVEGDMLNTVAKLSLYFTVGGGILPHHNHMTPLPFGVKESLWVGWHCNKKPESETDCSLSVRLPRAARSALFYPIKSSFSSQSHADISQHNTLYMPIKSQTCFLVKHEQESSQHVCRVKRLMWGGHDCVSIRNMFVEGCACGACNCELLSCRWEKRDCDCIQ